MAIIDERNGPRPARSSILGPDVGGDNDHTPRSTYVLRRPEDLRPCATLLEFMRRSQDCSY